MSISTVVAIFGCAFFVVSGLAMLHILRSPLFLENTTAYRIGKWSWIIGMILLILAPFLEGL